MKYEELYGQLNDEQKRAVNAIDGPLMVLAGPGTGKTQLLSLRTANILRQTDLYPSNVLLLTFTNAGVKAMRERLASIMGPRGYDVVVETFHSFANTLITESEEAVSIRGERIEMTDLERINLLEYLLDHLEGIGPIRHANAPYLYRYDIESNIGALRRDGIRPQDLEDFLKGFEPKGKWLEAKHIARLKAFAKIYRAYEESKMPGENLKVFDRRGRYDFDDMILMATEVLEKESDLLAKVREQFHYVMVDEFQDTNGAQLKLLLKIFSDPKSNVAVVGDDDQSIYRFQGASTQNFRLFEEFFLNSEKIVLKKNYRSVPSILSSADRIIHQLAPEERLPKDALEANKSEKSASGVSSYQFGTSEEELTFLIQEIKKLPKDSWNDTAVLVRTRKQVGQLIEAFLQAGIPYATDGKEDIRGEFRIQQLINVIRLAEGALSSEEKDVLIFEILLSDFWQIEHADLMLFVGSVHHQYEEGRKKMRRKLKKSDRAYQHESIQASFDLPISKKPSGFFLPTLLSELLLRFPAPERPKARDDEPPLPEETANLSVLKELAFKKPEHLHHASWALGRLVTRAKDYPVATLMLDFLADSGMIDFILQEYEDQEVIRLRELRAIGSFVENLKKANRANPGLKIDQYSGQLSQLERHEIALQGAMVSKNQAGVKILTAHSSKGLEFQQVFIPFCVQDLSWPKRERGKLIPLPHELLLGQEKVQDQEEEKKLHRFDELRLFYVAATRAKESLTFTAAPEEKQIISRYLHDAELLPKALTSIPEEEILISLIKKAPQPDPVSSSRETLQGLVEEISLSPSSVNRYLLCPRQFLYQHLLKTPKIQKPSLIYGQCVHKALEKSYRRFMKEGVMPDGGYFEDQFLEELEWEGAEQSVKQSCLQKFEFAKAWYQKMLAEGPIKPLELERQLVKKMPEGLVFKGKFDKVEMIGKDLHVRVVDYKTGNPDDHIKALQNVADIFSEECDDYLRQLIAYKMLYESGYRRRPVKEGQLVFLDPVKTSVKKYGMIESTFMNQSVSLTPEMVKDYEKLVLEVWRKIKALEFPRLPEFDEKKCGYCPYQGICWKN